MLDPAGVAQLPEDDVPPQILECACPLPGADRYSATRVGPGTLRDPMGKPDIDEEDASDEDIAEEEKCAEQPAEDEAVAHEHCAEQPTDGGLNQLETPLGLDPTITPSYVQHLPTFQTQLRQVEQACRESQQFR